jgi:hypothetical protein
MQLQQFDGSDRPQGSLMKNTTPSGHLRKKMSETRPLKTDQCEPHDMPTPKNQLLG